MPPTITVFERSPDRGQGLARDMRVRWALEEVGQPYEVRLVSFAEMKQPAHRALHPFGQIPTYEEGGLALFESGAIVLHVAERHPGLLPVDADARARAITWMFAALGTVEPPILDYETAMLLEQDKSWHEERLPLVDRPGPWPPRPAFRSSWRRRLARWRLQRGRPHDGDGAAKAVPVGPARRTIPTCQPMSPAPNPGRPSSGHSPPSLRYSPARDPAPDSCNRSGTVPDLRRFISVETATQRKVTPMSSTSDKVKGTANELAGKARKATGDAMDDPEMEAHGAAQETKGDLQKAKGDVKDGAKKVVDGA